jgi:hypothetical protein|nr:MAG TPA: hypothetical protein [Caudoviricetes sp.]
MTEQEADIFIEEMEMINDVWTKEDLMTSSYYQMSLADAILSRKNVVHMYLLSRVEARIREQD